MKFHHLGVPTHQPRPGEKYLSAFKLYVVSYLENPYHIEWMRFEPDCRLPEIVKTKPHLAFEVEDLEKAISGKKVIIAPNSPSPGNWVAFIEEDGMPVEFLQTAPSQK